MKTLSQIAMVLLLINTSFTQGQTESCTKTAGVYKTYNAYLQNQYTTSVCLDYKKNFIKQGGFDKVIIKSNGTKLTFKRGEIYGYSDNVGTYRYFHTSGSKSPYGYFNIEDTSGLVIYSQKHHSFRNNTIAYYYSKGLNEPIKQLNTANLTSDFNTIDFIKMIESLKNLVQKNGNVFAINELYKRYIR